MERVEHIVVDFSELKCKKCGNYNPVKAGYLRGKQRYKCKSCGYQFTPTTHHGKPETDKLLAVWLYLHGIPFQIITKLFNVTHKTVYDWVRVYSLYQYTKFEPVKSQKEASIVELDELCKFIQSNENKAGYGKVIAAMSVNLSTGLVDSSETMLYFQDFSDE